MIVVNLFGAPGSGKSTAANYIVSMLKMNGVNAELVTEFAKDKVWEESREAFSNQVYLLGEQSFRMSRCIGKVDVLVTDSPLPLNIIYNKNKSISKHFDVLVMDIFALYDNINFMLTRNFEYVQTGRHENESESNIIRENIVNLLKKRRIAYKSIESTQNNYDAIVSDIMRRIGKDK